MRSSKIEKNFSNEYQIFNTQDDQNQEKMDKTASFFPNLSKSFYNSSKRDRQYQISQIFKIKHKNQKYSRLIAAKKKKDLKLPADNTQVLQKQFLKVESLKADPVIIEKKPINTEMTPPKPEP